MNFTYLWIFFQSNLLEVPFYFLVLRRQGSIGKFLLLATAINSLTHPIVFFVIMNFKLSYIQNILMAESFAVLTESLFFFYVMKTSYARSLAASALANLVSWQLAPMFTYLMFRP